jgi:hypothetical protein
MILVPTPASTSIALSDCKVWFYLGRRLPVCQWGSQRDCGQAKARRYSSYGQDRLRPEGFHCGQWKPANGPREVGLGSQSPHSHEDGHTWSRLRCPWQPVFRARQASQAHQTPQQQDPMPSAVMCRCQRCTVPCTVRTHHILNPHSIVLCAAESRRGRLFVAPLTTPLPLPRVQSALPGTLGVLPSFSARKGMRSGRSSSSLLAGLWSVLWLSRPHWASGTSPTSSCSSPPSFSSACKVARMSRHPQRFWTPRTLVPEIRVEHIHRSSSTGTRSSTSLATRFSGQSGQIKEVTCT